MSSLKLSRFTNNIPTIFQWVVFLSINCLFIAKYITRTHVNLLVGLSLYLVVIFVLYLFVKRIMNCHDRTIKYLYFSLSLLILTGIVIIQYSTNPYSLMVDRWSAINNFIEYLFQGKYPYLAKTHLGGYGSPFPVWQFLHIPFYLLGNIALGMCFSFILLSITLRWYFSDYRKPLIFMLFLFVSPAFWYEVTTRSDLFYNLLDCLLIILVFHKNKYSISNHPIIIGIICGLFLSTRLSVFFPFLIYFFKDFMDVNGKQKLIFFSVSVLSFVISFAPLFIWDFHSLMFFRYNPFVLQTRQGSILEVILLLVVAILFSLKWKTDFNKCIHLISYSLLLLVLMTFIHNMILDNFHYGLFTGKYDITYFNMALPFCVFILCSHNFIDMTKA